MTRNPLFSNVVSVALMMLVMSNTMILADLSTRIIGIDPGHGGSDAGAVGSTGLEEADINLTTSLDARDYMLAANASVYMTRTTDVYVSLTARTDYLNSIPVHRAISIHHNASSTASANYTGVHVYPGTCPAPNNSGNLAYSTVQRLDDHLNIGFVSSNCSRQGVHEDNFHMLRETNMPAVLTENSFISNPLEETRLRSPTYLDANGWAIYAGLCDHYGQPATTPTPTRTPTAGGSEFIVDNRDAGFSTTGSNWFFSTYGTNYGADKTAATTGTGTGVATWALTLPAGQYAVTAWVTNAAYTTSAYYTVHHAGGSTAVTRSQYNPGGSWCISLGTFTFNGASSVTLTDNTTGGTVVADAIRWVLVGGATSTPTRTPTPTPTFTPTSTPTRTPSPTPTPTGSWSLIINDVDPGFTTSGATWTINTWGTNYGSGNEKHYRMSGTGSGLASWASSFAPGQYQLSAWVTMGAYTTTAHYSIHHAGGTTNLIRNQNNSTGGWCVDLGTYTFNGPGSVVLSDDSTEIVVADAIRWIMISGNTPTPAPSATRTSTPTRTPTPTPTTTGGPEFRGVWVTRWNYSSEADIVTIMQNAANAHFNAVLFQVRGRADAYYDSNYEPWAQELSGVLGQYPGWDPLQTAVTEAHERGLELHAYVNTFTCWSGTTPPTSTTPQHIYNSHPEWLQCDSSGEPMELNSGYVFVSPGIPAVHDHLVNVVRDIAQNYDVDGIHFDYIRYAGAEYSHDTVSEDRFVNDNPELLPWADWQRLQISEFTEYAYSELCALRSDLKVTAAVWGIYKDHWSWGTSEGYYDYYQDSQAWLENGIIDAICPMIYWPLYDGSPPYFDYLLDDFMDHSGGRHVYAGMSGDYDHFGEIADEIAYARSVGAPGHVVFAYSSIVSRSYWDDYLNGPYTQVVAPPAMPWKSITPTATPTQPPAAVPVASGWGLLLLVLMVTILIGWRGRIR